MQSVAITTNVASSNPVHGEVDSMQPYVVKFVSGLRQVGEPQEAIDIVSKENTFLGLKTSSYGLF
jgi:hypothetical protein